MCEVACSITSSGVPNATTSPPASPPSGPRSISQSLARITSRLCSITISECPASSSLRMARMSLAMSSKCRPVVGSSNMNNEPRLARVWRLAEARLVAGPPQDQPAPSGGSAPGEAGRVGAPFAASAKKPASLRRCASPPESVGTGWPSLTYSRPTSTMGCSARITSRSAANRRAASLTVRFSTSATFRVRPPRSTVISRISGR